MSEDPPSPPTSAAQQARAHWEAGTARFLTHGLVRPGHPRFDKERGLYTSSLGCVVTEQSMAYAKQYNAQLRALLEEFGLPS